MAPNPIMLPRKRQPHARPGEQKAALGLTWSILAASLTVALLATCSWARRWLLSGCAPETLLIIFGSSLASRIFPSIPLWTLLSSLNLVYAVASTSWLLYGAFAAACWPFFFLTCLLQFEFAADLARRSLRSLLRDLHFTRDRIALFNLPALEIDTEVAGLMVIRGVTISLSDLSLIAHGVEVAIKLTNDIELALHTDQVRVSFFRRIEISNIYANIKGGKAEMTFADVDNEEVDQDAFFNETPLLGVAKAGVEGIKDRPKLRASLAGVSYLNDTSAQTASDSVQLLSPDNQFAEQQYLNGLNEIRTSSAIYRSRTRVREAGEQSGLSLDDEKDIRAAICAELHDVPSVPHSPQHSVKVTTLQNLNKPAVKRFLHQLPFLLRLLLGPLGYFHPISVASINVAGSGQWLKELLQQQIFSYAGAQPSAEIRRIRRRISLWLADANFCLQLADVDGLGQVPISTSFDIVTYLHVAEITAYRTVPHTGVLERVARLGGAEATFTIPIFLLPHHEHLVPPRPTSDAKGHLEEEAYEADGIPKTVQAEKELERVKKDEATINMSIHASLPVAFDQSLLTFVAALVKATKIIEFDREVEKLDPDKDGETLEPVSRASTSVSVDTTQSSDSTEATKKRFQSFDRSDSIKSLDKGVQSDLPGSSPGGRFKTFAKNLQQNLREASINTAETFSKENVNDFVREVQQSTKGMRKAVVGSIVNDRWIAKLVGKVAANLERAQGELGYSGAIPISLEPYRSRAGEDGHLSKLLP